MKQATWKMFVRHCDGLVTVESFQPAAAEAAAYLAKIADPDADVSLHRARHIRLSWDGAAWFIVVLADGSKPMAKRCMDFRAACREHEALHQLLNAGVTFFG
ncbi:hypothetical protein [Caballeronia sp. Lep1P3]|uniref:hypothetical protein n=1 Tax=Caballeronia sp. Lep1P3 TaxID=2878150 RepID=UPI001FCFE3AC|nr:hypothetical protein [Caballeronia sp. Lep1P3]